MICGNFIIKLISHMLFLMILDSNYLPAFLVSYFPFKNALSNISATHCIRKLIIKHKHTHTHTHTHMKKALSSGVYVLRRGKEKRNTPWLIHVNVWQNPLQCCEVISLQLIKINEKNVKKEKRKKKHWNVATITISRKDAEVFFVVIFLKEF